MDLHKPWKFLYFVLAFGFIGAKIMILLKILYQMDVTGSSYKVASLFYKDLHLWQNIATYILALIEGLHY